MTSRGWPPIALRIEGQRTSAWFARIIFDARGDKAVNTSWLQVIVQAIPVLAAAGGLIYAGLQFRGWQITQYVSNFTKLVELQLQLRKMIVDDPALAPTSSVTPPRDAAEEMRRYYYALMQVSVFEIAWYTHKKGQLTDDYFASWEAAILSMAKYPVFRAMWRTDRTKIMHVGFRQYVDNLIEKFTVHEQV
jgi:hypothetical protein